MSKAREDYVSVLTAAIADLVENGYDSVERVSYWTRKIRDAAAKSMQAPAEMDRALRDALASVYRRMVENGRIAQFHQGVARFTLDKVRPQLRAELDRRILAAANLIKLNRQEAMEKTLRRFSGWATSIPKGGTDAAKRREVKDEIKKPLRQLSFVERRVLIDQGHKLVSSLNDILARDGGAIAAIWHSRWRQPGYDYREDHKERDGEVYLFRSSWAREKGLVKPGRAGYADDVTQPAEEPFCRCSYVYIYTLGKLPPDMLTAKGRAALAEARDKINAG